MHRVFQIAILSMSGVFITGEALSPHQVDTGLWILSLIKIVDIAACGYTFFDLRIVYAL